MTAAGVRSRRGRVPWFVGLVLALVCAGVLSFYASGSPDGLEYAAEQLGFAQAATDHAAASSPLADYQVAGVEDARLSGGLAGVVGTGIVLALSAGLMRALSRRTTES